MERFWIDYCSQLEMIKSSLKNWVDYCSRLMLSKNEQNVQKSAWEDDFIWHSRLMDYKQLTIDWWLFQKVVNEDSEDKDLLFLMISTISSTTIGWWCANSRLIVMKIKNCVLFVLEKKRLLEIHLGWFQRECYCRSQKVF